MLDFHLLRPEEEFLLATSEDEASVKLEGVPRPESQLLLDRATPPPRNTLLSSAKLLPPPLELEEDATPPESADSLRTASSFGFRFCLALGLLGGGA